MNSKFTQSKRLLFILFSALLIFSFSQLIFLHVSPAPFNQRYWLATDEQNNHITLQLIYILFLGPFSLLALTLLNNFRAFSIKLTLILLFFGLIAFKIWATLPYGFGSSYEHASNAQSLHLNLSFAVAINYIFLSIIFFIVLIIYRIIIYIKKN